MGFLDCALEQQTNVTLNRALARRGHLDTTAVWSEGASRYPYAQPGFRELHA